MSPITAHRGRALSASALTDARLLPCLLPLLLPLLLVPRGAQAQHCTEFPCGGLPPLVWITPGSGPQAGGSLQVTIEWRDDFQLNAGSRQIVWRGQDVTAQFTYTAQSWTQATSGGTVQIASGTQVLRASICDSDGLCSETEVTYTGPQPDARVTPENPSVVVSGNTSQMARYRVVNTGTVEAAFSLTASCVNTTACYVSAGVSSLALAAGDSGYVDVAYQSPSSGAAQVTLTASSGTVSRQGTVSVTAMATPAPGFPGDSASLMRIERAACITVAVGPSAAYDCGDLRITHPLPAVRELGRARAPVLIYNSQHARPTPIVSEQVTPRAGTSPDSVRVVLVVGGVQYTSSYPAWPAGTVRHVGAVVTSTLPTGVHPYTVEVRAHWNVGASEVLRTPSGRMVVVNRSGSPFGAGWWLSGLEELHHVGDTLKLWVGGDGSARLYRGGAAAGPWVAESFDRPDTLRWVGSEYVRTLPGSRSSQLPRFSAS